MESSNLAEIQKQIEYYLSNENLKHDEFFYNIIKESPNATVPVDTLLNCNKLKKLGATKDQVVSAIAGSEKLKITEDASGIKRSAEAELPEFEPRKQIKTDRGATKVQAYSAPTSESKSFEPKIFKITLNKTEDGLKWDKIQGEIQKATDCKIGYTRVNNTEGHFAVDLNNLSAEGKDKIVQTPVKIGEVEVKIEECLGDDLKKFYHDHGGHLDMCLERSGLKKKGKDRKGAKGEKVIKDTNRPVDFVFGNRRYTNLGPLKNIFKGIVMKTADDEEITGADHELLVELLKYHDSAEEKAKDLKHFTVGTHPLYKQTRCFFVVRNDGTKEDFSSTKCIENIRKKYDVGDE